MTYSKIDLFEPPLPLLCVEATEGARASCQQSASHVDVSSSSSERSTERERCPKAATVQAKAHLSIATTIEHREEVEAPPWGSARSRLELESRRVGAYAAPRQASAMPFVRDEHRNLKLRQTATLDFSTLEPRLLFLWRSVKSDARAHAPARSSKRQGARSTSADGEEAKALG